MYRSFDGGALAPAIVRPLNYMRASGEMPYRSGNEPPIRVSPADMPHPVVCGPFPLPSCPPPSRASQCVAFVPLLQCLTAA